MLTLCKRFDIIKEEMETPMGNEKRIFDRYIQIADVLGAMFQNVLEIAIHDFQDLDNAVIHIVNGHISGRAVGFPASELNIRRLFEEDAFPDTIINFASRNNRGQLLKSSSLAIRDDQGEIIGAFCLHFDVSQFENFQKFLEFFVNPTAHPLLGINDFGASQPHNEEILKEIENWRLHHGLLNAALTYEDKQAIVTHLYLKGFFQRKGAISNIANALQLTRQCIYNYQKKINTKKS